MAMGHTFEPLGEPIKGTSIEDLTGESLRQGLENANAVEQVERIFNCNDDPIKFRRAIDNLARHGIDVSVVIFDSNSSIRQKIEQVLLDPTLQDKYKEKITQDPLEKTAIVRINGKDWIFQIEEGKKWPPSICNKHFY